MTVRAIGDDLWKAFPEGKEKHQAYLCSRAWAEKRNAVFKRCGCICERCGVNGADSVHHLTYARKYGERLDDLQAICRECHEFTHGKSDFDPKPVIDYEAMRPLVESLAEGWGPASIVVCAYPDCVCENVHLSEPEYKPGEDRSGVDWVGRGPLIVIQAECEFSHEWELCIGFHKGTTVAFTRNHKETPHEDDDA